MIICNSYDKTNCPHKLFLTNRQVANLLKVFSNNLPTDTELLKTQLSKMISWQTSWSIKTGLPLMKNVIKSLAKSVLIPLELTAATSTADAGIHKKNLRVWNNNTNNIK